MQYHVNTVAEYLDELPEDRRAMIEAVRATVNKNLTKGFEEGIQYGHIGWYVPHSLYPAGYHCDPKQPLPFIGLANQKGNCALYLFCLYTDSGMMGWFQDEWAKTGLKLDMGKSCLRFKKLEALDLDLIGKLVGKIQLEDFVSHYEDNLPPSKRKK